MQQARRAGRISVFVTASAMMALGLAACGGGDGGSGPVAVASVVITAPATPPSFQTFGRTRQFTAQALDASNGVIAGASFIWTSSNEATATISPAGLLTVVGNGTTQVRATAGGTPSAPMTVSVNQLLATLSITPATVTFGALGSARQLTWSGADSGGANYGSAVAVIWSRLGSGSTAVVSSTGVVTAIGVGTSDTAVATADLLVAKAPITVTQVAADITVSADAEDSLSTTGRTRQYSAVVRDSNANVMGSALTWSSTVPGVASVDASTGLATAISDGTTDIRATSGTVFGARGLLVKRFASTFTLTPGAATITTNGGTQNFSGSALDSVGTALPMSWLSRLPGVATVAPSTGTSTTATATGNGDTYIVLSAGTRLDSAQLVVSGQASLPSAIAVTIGDFFFQSARNNTQNAAIDTVAVGGTVTWNFTGSFNHSVRSLGSPSFVSSGLQNTGVFVRTFTSLGTYQYDCQLHASMTGTIVVR